MQVDPIKPTLKAPGTESLKLKYYRPLSNSAFKFNLRRYHENETGGVFIGTHHKLEEGATGRGLHSSTLQLNLSRFLSLTPPTDTQYPTKKRAYVEPKSGRVYAPGARAAPCA